MLSFIIPKYPVRIVFILVVPFAGPAWHLSLNKPQKRKGRKIFYFFFAERRRCSICGTCNVVTLISYVRRIPELQTTKNRTFFGGKKKGRRCMTLREKGGRSDDKFFFWLGQRRERIARQYMQKEEGRRGPTSSHNISSLGGCRGESTWDRAWEEDIIGPNTFFEKWASTEWQKFVFGLGSASAWHWPSDLTDYERRNHQDNILSRLKCPLIGYAKAPSLIDEQPFISLYLVRKEESSSSPGLFLERFFLPNCLRSQGEAHKRYHGCQSQIVPNGISEKMLSGKRKG